MMRGCLLVVSESPIVGRNRGQLVTDSHSDYQEGWFVEYVDANHSNQLR